MNSVEIFPPAASSTEQIMSRYRPIAPRPQLPPSFNLENPTQPSSIGNFSTEHVQTRPFRSRKRNNSAHPTTANKKSKTQFSEICSNTSQNKTSQIGLSLQGFSHGFPGFSSTNPNFNENPTRNPADLITLSLLPYSCTIQALNRSIPTNNSTMVGMNLNTETGILFPQIQEIPEEKDLLQKLQAPFSVSLDSGCGNVIVPQPVRPVGSRISMSEISSSNSSAPVSKKPEDVEEEMELDSLPALISDSHNRVRLANSAYKKMVGQPECKWLDSTVHSYERLTASTKRINGEVMLIFEDSTTPISSSNGFSCTAKIEWINNGEKMMITAPCEVIRLSCDSKDYLFAWRFHTSKASDGSEM